MIKPLHPSKIEALERWWGIRCEILLDQPSINTGSRLLDFFFLRDLEMEAGSLPAEGKGPLSSPRTLAEHDQRNGKSAQEDWLELVCLLYAVLRSKYTQPLGESTQNNGTFRHHSPESLAKQPSVWQLNWGACFLPFLGSDDSRLSFTLQKTDKHVDKRKTQRISRYYCSQQLQAQDISGDCNTLWIQRLNFNINTQGSNFTKGN